MGHLTNEPNRAALAIVANAQTPYRLHLHRRFAAEIPEVKLWSLFLAPVGNDPWTAVDEAIGPAPLAQDWKPRRGPAGWIEDRAIGGRAIRWLKAHPAVRAVMVLGWAGPGRLRLIRWCQRNRIPVLVWGDSNIRGDSAAGPKRLLKNLLLPRLLRQSAACLCCGRLGREFFLRYGVDPARIFISPYEPDYALVQQLRPEQIESVMRQFGLTRGRRRIVFSGRMVPDKRPDLLIHAFLRIAADRPEWDLIMVGAGELRESLEGRVPRALRSRVTWTGFLNDQATISAIYRASDVLSLPSDREPWALVINEAVAAGMAVVASDAVGAAAELVRDRVNGRIFPAGDLDALADCLLDVTAAAQTDRYRSAAQAVLDDWRRIGDPVQGLRRALASCGVLPQTSDNSQSPAA